MVSDILVTDNLILLLTTRYRRSEGAGVGEGLLTL